ncbi:hypothetical protein CYMTET_37169 [Cymbomonas tetramitiformis]|uniref:ATP-dependent helicase Rep n=1 Tax=Cymbomonas tetramitiformis TaxID=36881 RepID=A0AAE0CGV0_9CHLO|nr:hypothetical protein CYMTET_37169 [Cymbomonas tetramitiformis]|eukprot:gene11786-13916_t
MENDKKKSRNFVFTFNNYQTKAEEHVAIDALDCRYMKYGKEVAPTTGTPHLQGMVCFKNAISLKSVRKKLPGCDVRIMISLEGSLDYVGKEGDVTERGEKPMSQDEKGKAGEAYWQEIRLAAEEGRDDDIPEQVRFNNYKAVEHHREKALKRRHLANTEEQMLWYYGETRTGKSQKARTDHPTAYLKNCNKWWCGYEDDKVVIIEDFDKKHDMLIHFLKIWADRYPFLAEIKCGSRKIRPELIIVTSNYHPRDIWVAKQDLEPILERFKCVKFSKLHVGERGSASQVAFETVGVDAGSSESMPVDDGCIPCIDIISADCA